MFESLKNKFTHMPFVTAGGQRVLSRKAFCCIMLNKRWKLHYFDGEFWKRVNTGLPYDTTECSPTAKFENGKWIVSFVAGGHSLDRSFYLYRIEADEDFKNFKVQKVVGAEVGFIFENKLVYGKRGNRIWILENDKMWSVSFKDVLYLYRVSYNATKPDEYLISGKLENGEFFSWAVNFKEHILKKISVDNACAYKMAMFKDELYYALKDDSAGFEDRHVVMTRKYDSSILSFDEIVNIAEEKLTTDAFELLKNFTTAFTRWVKSGFKIVDAQTLSKRTEICATCEFLNGHGSCLKCGCSALKLKLASEKCPIEKW